MLKVFFITALVHTTMTPDTGWMQWTQSYATQEACHKVIWEDFDKIHEAIKSFMDKKNNRYYGTSMYDLRRSFKA